MTIVRLFSIIFSTLFLLLVSAVAAWLLTMQRVESGVLEMLHNIVGVQVDFDAIHYHRNLSGTLTMENVSLRKKIGPILYRHNLGTIAVQRDFLGGGKLKVTLPYEQTLSLLHDNGISRTYTINLENSHLTFLGDNLHRQLDEIYFSTGNLKITEEKQGTILAAGNAYILFQDQNDTYRISLNRANIQPWWHKQEKPLRLESFLIDFDSARLPGFTRTLIMPFLLKTNVEEVVEDLHFFVKEAQAVKGLFVLNALKVTLPADVWFSADGDIALDNKNRPWGNLGFSSNEIEELIKRLPEFGVQETALKSYSFRRTMPKDNDVGVIDVDTRTGVYKVNGIPAGEVKPLTHMFTQSNN